MGARPFAGPRDAAESLLFDYTAIADRKDVDAVAALFAHATVTFPTASVEGESAIRELYGTLWESPVAHRHVVTNVRVEEDEASDSYLASALYARWTLGTSTEPVMTTLGEYELGFTLTDGVAIVRALTVTRSWQIEP